MPHSIHRSHAFDPFRFSRPIATEEERQQRIAQAAYLRAQARNFEPGHEIEDWLAAEAEVDAQIAVQPRG